MKTSPEYRRKKGLNFVYAGSGQCGYAGMAFKTTVNKFCWLAQWAACDLEKTSLADLALPFTY
jgi:hypothetical protein